MRWSWILVIVGVFLGGSLKTFWAGEQPVAPQAGAAAPGGSETTPELETDLLSAANYQRLVRRDLREMEYRIFLEHGEIRNALDAALDVLDADLDLHGLNDGWKSYHPQIAVSVTQVISLQYLLPPGEDFSTQFEKFARIILKVLNAAREDEIAANSKLATIAQVAEMMKENAALSPAQRLQMLSLAKLGNDILVRITKDKADPAIPGLIDDCLNGSEKAFGKESHLYANAAGTMGQHCWMIGQHDRAIALFEIAISKSSPMMKKFSPATAWLRGAYIEVAREALASGHIDSAQKTLDKAVALNELCADDSEFNIDARLWLVHAKALAQLSPAQRADLRRVEQDTQTALKPLGWSLLSVSLAPAPAVTEVPSKEAVAKGLTALRGLFTKRQELLGLKNTVTLEAASYFWSVALNNQQYDNAIELFQLAWPAFVETLGKTHSGTKGIFNLFDNQLSQHFNDCLKTDKWKLARETATQLVELQSSLYGKDSWQANDARNSIATASVLEKAGSEKCKEYFQTRDREQLIYSHYRAGRFKEALAIAEEVLKRDRNVLPPDHLKIAIDLDNIGSQYRELGDRDRAVANFSEAKTILNRANATLNPFSIRILLSVGYAHNKVGDADRAVTAFTEARDLAEKLEGNAGELYANATRHLALGYGNKGQPVRSLTLAGEAWGYYGTLAQPGNHTRRMVCQHYGRLLRTLSRYSEAERALRQVVEETQQALGKENLHYIEALNDLSVACYFKRDYQKAVELHLEVNSGAEKVLGREHYLFSQSLSNLAVTYHMLGDQKQEQQYIQRYLEHVAAMHGKQSKQYASALKEMGTSQLGSRGILDTLSATEAVEAKKFLQESVDVFTACDGADSLGVANALLSLGQVHLVREEFEQSRALLEKAAAIFEMKIGNQSSNYLGCLTNIGNCHLRNGQLGNSVKYLRQVVQACDKPNALPALQRLTAYGYYAEALLNADDVDEADLYLRKATRICRDALGDHHPRYAVLLELSATLAMRRQERELAERFVQKSLQIKREVFGQESSRYADGIRLLARIMEADGRAGQAADLLRTAAGVYRRLQANVMAYECEIDLARALRVQGKFEEAGQILSAVEIGLTPIVGSQHAVHARVWREQIRLKWLQGDAEGASAIALANVENARQRYEQTCVALSGRQQLRALDELHDDLSLLLSVSGKTSQTREVYTHVLASKGAFFLNQKRERLLLHDAGEQMTQLATVIRSLAALSHNTPTRDEERHWAQQARDLTREKERLEVEIRSKSSDFRDFEKRSRVSSGDIASVLPPKTVLVDILEYDALQMAVQPADQPAGGQLVLERHVVAFVLGGGNEILRIELGPQKPIAEAVEAFRAALESRKVVGDESGAHLQRLIWEPLSSQIQGSDTVLISPDGDLARCPFSALPAREKGKYLIEDVAIAVVAFPAMIPEVVSHERSLKADAAKDAERDGKGSLLIVGDVDFGAKPGSSDVPGQSRSSISGVQRGKRDNWQRLPATRAEALAIRDSFESRFADSKVEFLRGPQATESAVRNASQAHRWLHLATHGFFATAPEGSGAAQARSGSATTLDHAAATFNILGYDPGLRSGLVLAGANTDATLGEDDGHLTATEVSQLNLPLTELVVLSACETGLGENANGEGVMGLQRAFQIAGARNVICTLWKVDDEGTRALITRFYENMWTRGMPKLQALREAQVWMLNEGKVRGLQAVAGEKPVSRIPPYYWAAFVLSGDWR